MLSTGPVVDTKRSRRERRKKRSQKVQPTESTRKGSMKPNLTVDTRRTTHSPAVVTPTTVGSTHGAGLRGNGDLRSPGADKSPTNAAIPDFITQTDRFGNAVTPRTEGGINQAKEQTQQPAVEEVDPCETILDSIRLMCCCLLPEDEPRIQKPVKTEKDTASLATIETTVEEAPEDEEKVKLLPPMHRDDKGKKCLVLDLDETLVHSSFRSVPGADFVIPVQVRSFLVAVLVPVFYPYT